VAGGTVLRCFARAALRPYAQQVSDLSGGAGLLFEVSPLPAGVTAVLKALSGGLPVLYLLAPAMPAPVLATGASRAADNLAAGGQPVLTTQAEGWFGVCFQDRIVRDPAAWAAEIVAALQAVGAEPGQWPDFTARLAPVWEPRVYVLDQVGRPLKEGRVTVSVDGGRAVDVDFGPGQAQDGDTGVILPAGSRASVAFTSGGTPVVADAEQEGGSVAQAFSLVAGDRHVQVLDLDRWFAAAGDRAGLPRFSGGNRVEPIVDGTPYFRKLVPDLRAAKAGGGIHLAGWAFIKGLPEDPTIEWPLIPEDDTTRLLPLVAELLNGGGGLRFLVNQFVQLEGNLDDGAHIPEALLVLMIAALAAVTAFKIETDPAGYGVLFGGGVLGANILDQVLLTAGELRNILELSRDTVDALNALPEVRALPGNGQDVVTWAPYPAAVQDNPLAQFPRVPGITIDDVKHFGVYHQKMVIIQRADQSFVGYLGGIDINSDRIDTPLHRALNPFHDAQACVKGPAVRDLAQTFSDRIGPGKTVFNTPAEIPEAGSHLVQIARTYFVPDEHQHPATPPLAYAPNGETIIVETLMKAIAAARDFIYIEDQYLTPNHSFVQALLDAAAGDARALVIAVPTTTDQPFGGDRRREIFAALQSGWGARLRVGAPIRRYVHTTPEVTTNLGRCVLRAPIGAGDNGVSLGPLAHLPAPPFWLFVEGELMFCPTARGEQDHVRDRQLFDVLRGPGPNATYWGAKPTEHDEGAPAMCVRIPGIYVHAKVMIVDDVFVSIGSANLNRRGLFHDGEINCFTVPGHLKRDPDNPARILRCRLWAEHLGLSPEMGLSLLADPLSALPYFDRSWYAGCRWQPLTWSQQPPPLIDLGTGGSLGNSLITSVGAEFVQLGIGVEAQTNRSQIWATMVDPTCPNDPDTDPLFRGPDLP
jgi:phosphatidylserine/phosphatidylglycerophosphate/cardiolipin synthase-like enzyme